MNQKRKRIFIDPCRISIQNRIISYDRQNYFLFMNFNFDSLCYFAKRWYRSVGCLSILALFTACGKESPLPHIKNKPLVLVSVAPYQFFVQKIAGDHVEVRSIVKLGADIHTYEPTPRQRDSLKEAQIWFRIGEPFEKKLLSLFQNQWIIVDLRNGVDLLSLCSGCCNGCDNQDRHMWLSPKIAQIQAREISKTLCNQFPLHRDAFEANLQALLSDLESLDQEIRLALHPIKNHTLLVSHPAFGYFCRDYSLEQLSVEFEGKDPCTKYLSALVNQAKLQRPAVAISLPQHNNKGIEMISDELQLPIKMVDPYSHDYFITMHTLTNWITSQP
jgi:zinc transport system substrate-binding protein